MQLTGCSKDLMKQFLKELADPVPDAVTEEGDWLFVFHIDMKAATNEVNNEPNGFRLRRSDSKPAELIAKQAAAFIGTHMQYALEAAGVDIDKVYFMSGPDRGDIVACIEDGAPTAAALKGKAAQIFQQLDRLEESMFANWRPVGGDGKADCVIKKFVKPEGKEMVGELLVLLGKAHGTKVTPEINGTEITMSTTQLRKLAAFEQSLAFSMR